MLKLAGLLLSVVLALAWVPSAEAQALPLPKEKQTKLAKYLTAKEAHDVLTKDRSRILFIDIRTRGELQFVGAPTDIDGHVPFVEMNEFGEWDDKAGRYKLEPNPTFSQSIERFLSAKGLKKDDQIILICRSGDRSARAIDQMITTGFSNVWTVVDGFEGDMSPDGRRTINGWKNANLPWSYKLTKSKMHIGGK